MRGLSLGLGLGLNGVRAGANTPDQFGDLYAQFDATDASSLTITSGLVDQWSDISGNNRHATASGTYRPATNQRLNEVQALAFGAGQTMAIANSAGLGNSNYTMLIAMQSLNGTGGTQRWLIGSDVNMGLQYLGGQLRSVNSSAALFASTPANNTNTNVYGMIRNGATVTNILNGITANTIGAQNANNTGLFIGGNGPTSGNLFGYIGEILIYSGVMTTENINAAINYLNNKWIVYKGPQPAFSPETSTFRSAATQNRLGFNQQTYGTDGWASHAPKYVPYDFTSFRLNHNSFYRNGTQEVLVANPFTIEEAYIYNEAGTVGFAVTSSGADGQVVPGGAFDLNSDTITAASQGLPFFPAGVYWIKLKGALGSANPMPYVFTRSADVANTQFWFFNKGSTTVSTAKASGVFTYAGGGPQIKGQGYIPILLGEPVSDIVAYAGIGDSILDYNADTAANIHGDSPFNRLMGLKSYTGINMAQNGSSTPLYTANERWQSMLKYCNKALVEIGTNDISNNGMANVGFIYQRINWIYDTLKYYNISTIWQSQYMLRTTGTYTTLAGQNVSLGWTAGGNAETLYSMLAAQVGTKLTGVLTTASIRDTTTPQKWRTDGDTTAYTNDGLHGLANAYALVSAEWAGLL